MPNDTKPTPSDIVIMAAGAVMLIFSFFAFYKLGSESRSAWSSENGLLLFPLTTFVVLFGVVMAAQVAVADFAKGLQLPERVLGFTWTQLHLILGAQATLMMLMYLIRNKGGLSFGIGFWFMLISAIALLVGAILRTRETAGPARDAETPPPAV